MAAFLSDQLDFIFFFYGLAFILLGATCWIATSRGGGATWALLGGFGFVHGIGEWLDLTALIVGDTPTFAVTRMAGMTLSFLLLMDFARMEGIRLGLKLPGRWIYVILAMSIALICIADGPTTAGIVARYAIGFTGAAGAGVALAWRARLYSDGARAFAIAASGGFILYAVTSGLVVPAGEIWPSTILNYDAFTALTGMPVQLVRGLLACWLSLTIWGIWSQQTALEMGSPRYSAYVREQFIWTLVVMGAILVSGWTLTEYLGGVYRENVEREARTDIDMLASRVAGDTATIQAMTQSLAGSPSVLSAVTGGNQPDRINARAALDLDIDASGAESGYILDRTGSVVVSSTARDTLPAAADVRPSPAVLAAIGGTPTGSFAFDRAEKAINFSMSYPIRAGDGTIAGVAVLTRSLASLGAKLREFDRPYFLVDPDGVVAMSNRPNAVYRSLWPLEEGRKSPVSRRAGRPDDRPMLKHSVTDESWTMVGGERNYVLRHFIDDSGWSLVILKPPRQIFATRFLGIVITLLVTMMALIYLLGQARRVHDDVERDNRRKLQDLAQDLGEKATTDALTGLNNRLKLNTALADEIGRADRYETPLTLVMFDIDHFKMVNDTYGHSAGDSVLVGLARLVSSHIRNNDSLFRWGGEEFVILMPGIDELAGYQSAERCRQAIERVPFDQAGKVTCSFGVAQYALGESGDDLVARADEALYSAKESGRNQVKLAFPGPGAGNGADSLRLGSIVSTAG